MKKYMKRIVSWMCAVLMTLSMAVPVLATDSSANSVSETENRPSGVGVSFYQGTEKQIEVGNGKSKITLDLSFVNPSPGVETKPINNIIFCFKNEMGECSFYTTLKNGFSFSKQYKSGNFTIYGSNVQNNTEKKIKEGTYKLKEIKLTFTGEDPNDETKKTILPVSQDITIEVKNPLYAGDNNDDSKPDFGDISIGLNPDMTAKSMDVNLNDDHLSQKIKYYFKVTGKSGVKGITVSWGRYVDGKFKETGNTARVTKEGEGLYSSYCILQSGSETGVYKMSKIVITDDNDAKYRFYNPAFKEYANEQNTFNADFVLNVNNSIDPDKLSLYSFGFVNEALNEMSIKITVKTNSEDKVRVPFRINTKAINNEISLKNVYFETVDSNGNIVDCRTVGGLQKDGNYYNGEVTLKGLKAGKYNINKIKLISSNDKEYSYSVNDGSFTVNMGRENTLIVKDDDRILEEETGVTPVSKKVEESTDGTAKAELKVGDEHTLEGINLDEAAKKFVKEEYTFNIESKDIPENTTIEIGKVIVGNIYNNVKEAIKDVVSNVNNDIRVFEINLLNAADKKIPLNGNVTITTDIPAGFNPLKIEVYRLGDDGKSKIKVESKAENGKVTFVTNHFSTYIIAQTAGQGQIVVPVPDPDDIWDTDDEEDPVIIASEERPTGSATTIKDKSPVTSDSAPVVVLLLVFVSAVALFGMCVSKKIIK